MTNEEIKYWLEIIIQNYIYEDVEDKLIEMRDIIYNALDIQTLEQEPITWIIGKDNCQVAVRNMPIDKMQKICAIIGEEEQQTAEDYDWKALWEQVRWERDVAIEQLEQLGYSLGEKIQTAEDCVSREKVMNIIDAEAWSFCDWLIREGRNAEQQPVSHYADNLREKINDKTELPSVTSKKKVGRWTLVDNFVDTTCECSSCHYKDYIPKEIDITYWFKRKYCPNCGCMMIDEPEMKCGED